MIARARNSLFLFLCWLPACAGADQAGLYHNAGIERMPRNIDDLKLVKSDARLVEITTPVFGRHSIIRLAETSPGVPLINDSASRRTVVIVFDQPSLTLGRNDIGKRNVVAYLTAGPPSRPVGAYCLGMATSGFVDIRVGREGFYDVDFDLTFSEVNAADFKDVCHEERIAKSLHNLRLADLRRLAPTGDRQ